MEKEARIRIFIDGDGCPVVEETLHIAQIYNTEVCIVCDTSHDLYYEGVKTIMADKGRDAADYVILRNIQKNDILITQDFGLAALALSKSAIPVSFNGLLYTDENIYLLLNQRSDGIKNRKHKQWGYRIKKRTKVEDRNFQEALQQLLEKEIGQI